MRDGTTFFNNEMSRPNLLSAMNSLRRMQEELHRVPGSSPGRALTGAVAQRVEQMFLQRLPPQVQEEWNV
jgi:hypothetical protein